MEDHVSVQIERYSGDHEDLVQAFNRRLGAAASPFRFPECHVPQWLPRRADFPLYQECFLAVDAHREVRGGYILKHQEFYCNSKIIRIADYQLPLSEGIVDGKYNFVGLRLLTNALSRQKSLFAMGIGGLRDPLSRMLKAMRWQIERVPFFFRVLHPNAFLRNAVPLRRSTAGRLACSLLASTGLGWLAVKGLQLGGRRRRLPRSIDVEEVAEFSPWVDEVWDRCKDHYALAAVRDCRVLRTLYPAGDPRFIRLKITRDGSAAGWAVVMATAMADHNYFKDMKVGTVVDCLAAPDDATSVAASAMNVLESQGVDLIVSNQSHAAWCNALRQCGCLNGPSNYLFAASPHLAKIIGPLESNLSSFHFNRGDGDGPINL